MNRGTLIDNLVASSERRELVTLALRPVVGAKGPAVVSGRVVAIAAQYTARRSLVVVFAPEGRPAVLGGGALSRIPVAIGLSMIIDMQVGSPSPAADPSPTGGQ